MSNSIIDAVKRLQKSGGENSRMTEKLKDAANRVAYLIIDECPPYINLPRGYSVVKCMDINGYMMINPSDTWQWCLRIPVFFDDYSERTYYILGPTINGSDPFKDIRYTPADRTACFHFSKDISEGLMDEISEFLENRAKKTEQAIEQLEKVL